MNKKIAIIIIVVVIIAVVATVIIRKKIKNENQISQPEAEEKIQKNSKPPTSSIPDKKISSKFKIASPKK